MTDAELADYLGITDEPFRDSYIASMDPKRRAAYENMAEVELALSLWVQALGPKPEGVIVCEEPHYGFRRGRW